MEYNVCEYDNESDVLSMDGEDIEDINHKHYGHRSSAYFRDVRERKIKRKKRIIKNQNNYWHYKYDGVLSKGKIHCSCWLCRSKSKDCNTVSDIKKIISLADNAIDCGLSKADVNSIKSSISYKRNIVHIGA